MLIVLFSAWRQWGGVALLLRLRLTGRYRMNPRPFTFFPSFVLSFLLSPDRDLDLFLRPERDRDLLLRFLERDLLLDPSLDDDLFRCKNLCFGTSGISSGSIFETWTSGCASPFLSSLFFFFFFFFSFFFFFFFFSSWSEALSASASLDSELLDELSTFLAFDFGISSPELNILASTRGR